MKLTVDKCRDRYDHRAQMSFLGHSGHGGHSNSAMYYPHETGEPSVDPVSLAQAEIGAEIISEEIQ